MSCLYHITEEMATMLSIITQRSGMRNYFRVNWNTVNIRLVNADCSTWASLYFTENNFESLRQMNEAGITLRRFPSTSLSTNGRVAETTAHTPCHPRPPGGGLQRKITTYTNACMSIQRKQMCGTTSTHSPAKYRPKDIPPSLSILHHITHAHMSCERVCA